MIHFLKKPHRPFQGSEADRLFCCFAGRGTGTRPCGALPLEKVELLRFFQGESYQYLEMLLIF